MNPCTQPFNPAPALQPHTFERFRDDVHESSWLAKDESPDMSAPRAALLKRLDEVATKDWLAVLRESTQKK
jgi:hypothetical protein